MDQSDSQFIVVLGLSGTCFPPKLPLPFGDRYPHVTHCSRGQAHLSSQTASRSVQTFLYGFQMLCCPNRCQWGRNPQNCLFLLGFRHPAGGEPSYGHRQHPQKMVKIVSVVFEISSRTDRQTDRHTQRQTYTRTYSSQYFATASAGEHNYQFKTRC